MTLAPPALLDLPRQKSWQIDAWAVSAEHAASWMSAAQWLLGSEFACTLRRHVGPERNAHCLKRGAGDRANLLRNDTLAQQAFCDKCAEQVLHQAEDQKVLNLK